LRAFVADIFIRLMQNVSTKLIGQGPVERERERQRARERERERESLIGKD